MKLADAIKYQALQAGGPGSGRHSQGDAEAVLQKHGYTDVTNQIHQPGMKVYERDLAPGRSDRAYISKEGLTRHLGGFGEGIKSNLSPAQLDKHITKLSNSRKPADD